MNALKLKSRMVEAGMTQQEVAQKMNVSKNTISRKINGQVSFTTDEVIKLCEMLGISDNREKCEIFLTKTSH